MATAATVIQNQRDAQNAKLAEDLSQSASVNPFHGEEALEALIREDRAKAAEFQKLTTEESRRQYKAMLRDNLLRGQASEQNRQAEAQRFNDLQHARDQRDETAVAQMFTQLAATKEPGENAWNMPISRLRTIGQVSDKARPFLSDEQLAALNQTLDPYAHPLDQTQALAAQAPQAQRIPTQQNKPIAFDDGRFSHITDNGDGTFSVELPTGEKFSGDAKAIIEQQAKSFVHTKRWAQGIRDTAGQVSQTAQQTVQQAMQSLPDNGTQAASIADYWAQQQSEALARRYGFSNEQEMIQHFGKLSEQAGRMEDMETASTFMAACPDFPCTEEASNTVAQIVNQNGWDFTPQSMEAAYRLAVARGQVQPLPAEAQDAQSGNVTRQRPTAPPMISSQSPDGSQQNWNPWDTKAVNLADLRRAAIAQELEGRR